MPRLTRPRPNWRYRSLSMLPAKPYCEEELEHIAELLGQSPLYCQDVDFLQETAQLYLVAKHNVDNEPRAARRPALLELAQGQDPLRALKYLDDASKKVFAVVAD